MRRQVQIQDGIVRATWLGSGELPMPPDGTWTFLEVTGQPEGQAGDLYDAATHTFTRPPPPGEPAVTNRDLLVEIQKLTKP